MSEFPSGWTDITIEELVDILDSVRVPLNAEERDTRIAGKRSEDLFPYYGATGQVGYIDDFIFDEPLILLGEDGVPFLDPVRPKAYRISGKCWVNNHAHVLRVRTDVADERFIVAFLNAFDYTGYVSGSTRLKLTQGAMRAIPVRLAPLKEQKRIADKLDAILARVDACRERLDRVPSILKRFRQAVLATATAGKLTEAWRALNDTERWRTVKLSEVAKSRLGKMLDKAKNQGAATPYLRNINVRWFGFDLSDIQTIRVTEDEARELAVEKGDVLICEGGEPGRCAVWQGENSIYVYQKALHRVRVGQTLTPEWLCYSLKDAADSGRLTDLFTGTTIKHLTGVALGQFELPLPPLREQHEIIHRVETLFAYADRFETRYTAARAQVDRLTPALLAKAFRGELVPQDPNDESASILLERIRAARAAAGEKPPRKVRTERKPMTTKLTTDALKEVICGLPTDQFTFDDLRGQVSADYETLKDVVFALLSEAPASIKQVFDTEAKTMRLVRVKR